MIPPIIPSSLMLIALVLVRYGVESSPATGLVRSPNQPVITTTTVSPAASFLEDPSDSATTSENTEESTNDDACVVRCFDKVTIAQDMVKCYENISRKQKNLISRKRAAAEAAAMNAATTNNKSRPNKLIRSANTNTNSQNSTLNLRTLVNHQELIVVSSLRVARSTSFEGQVPKQRPPNKDKHWLNKKDAELERLQREQQRQKDITCKSLLEVRYCLDQQLQECLGNLQFHSYQVYTDQYYERLRCPYPNKPNMAPFMIVKTMEEEKLPIARPITSPEEVRKRLQEILPGRQFPKPMGVVRLEPTQTQNQIRPVEQKGSYRLWSHPNYTGGDDSLAVGRILLIPAGFAILIALVAVLRYKRTWNYEEKGNSENQEY